MLGHAPRLSRLGISRAVRPSAPPLAASVGNYHRDTVAAHVEATGLGGKGSAMHRLQWLRRQNTTLRAALVATGLVLLGVGCMGVSNSVNPHPRSETPAIVSRERVSDVAGELGSVLVGAAVLSVLWDVVARRAFVEELLGRINGVADLESGGLRGLTFQFLEDIEWRDLFRSSSRVDIFIAYGQGWRGLNSLNLAKFTARTGTRLRVVLPDPDDAAVVAALATRFDTDADGCASKIREAIAHFQSLRQTDEGDRVAIWLTTQPMLFTSYRFDRTCLVALYSHQPVDVEVPTFICEQGGSLYKYVETEFAVLVEGATAGRMV